MIGRIVLVAFFLAGTSLTGVLEILGDPMRPAIADGVAIDKNLGYLDRIRGGGGSGLVAGGPGGYRGAIVG